MKYCGTVTKYLATVTISYAIYRCLWLIEFIKILDNVNNKEWNTRRRSLTGNFLLVMSLRFGYYLAHIISDII